MRRTPDEVSKARQALGREMESWGAEIVKLRPEPGSAEKAKYYEEQMKECRKKMRSLIYKSKKKFWSFKN
jgi:hypothetical protein